MKKYKRIKKILLIFASVAAIVSMLSVITIANATQNTHAEQVITIENVPDSGVFYNTPIIGTVEITKIDVISGKQLSNVGFRIKDSSGVVIAEGVTDENGVVRFDNLRYGKYKYQEYKAPNGFVINKNEYPFEIKKTGEVIKITMENEPKIGRVSGEMTTSSPNGETVVDDNPFTGVINGNIYVLVTGILAVLVAGSMKRKGKKADE